MKSPRNTIKQIIRQALTITGKQASSIRVINLIKVATEQQDDQYYPKPIQHPHRQVMNATRQITIRILNGVSRPNRHQAPIIFIITVKSLRIFEEQ
jgi:hypothetical protein